MVSFSPNQHILHKFDEKMEDLRNQVLKTGGFVEQQVRRAVDALRKLDLAEADAVSKNDHFINRLEVAIDEDCTRILVCRQPAASDLRLIIAVVKTITDLERIGDHAMNIGEYVIDLVMGKDIRHISIEEVEKGVLV
jgi:phosphate transport system protein